MHECVDRWTGGWMYWWADSCMDLLMGGQLYVRMYVLMGRQLYGCIDGWTDAWMYWWVGRCINVLIGGGMHECIDWWTGGWMCWWADSCMDLLMGGQLYVCPVNIPKIRKHFVHFKSYLLHFRRKYKLLCCLLAKIRDFLQNWNILCRHF